MKQPLLATIGLCVSLCAPAQALAEPVSAEGGTAAVQANAADADEPTSDEQVVRALYRCFMQHVSGAHSGQSAIPTSASTDLFFWDQLAAAMQEMGSAPRLLWCQPWFVEPLRRAQQELAARAKQPGARAALSMNPATQGLDDASLVVRAAAPWGGSMARGSKADVVREALDDALLDEWHLSAAAKTWLLRGASAPDLFLFAQPIWHALTPVAPPPSPLAEQSGATDRSQDLSQQARTAFVAHAQQLLQEAQRGRDTTALVRLGMAASLVVDLYKYQGTSQTEQAAQHFVVGHKQTQQNFAQREQVRQALVTLFYKVFGEAGPGEPAELQEGAAAPTEAQLLARVQQIAPQAQRLAADALWRDWRLAHRSRAWPRGPRVQPAQALLPPPWDAPATLAEILAGL